MVSEEKKDFMTEYTETLHSTQGAKEKILFTSESTPNVYQETLYAYGYKRKKQRSRSSKPEPWKRQRWETVNTIEQYVDRLSHYPACERPAVVERTSHDVRMERRIDRLLEQQL